MAGVDQASDHVGILDILEITSKKISDLVSLCKPGAKTMLNAWKSAISNEEEIILVAAVEASSMEVIDDGGAEFPILKVSDFHLPLDEVHWKAIRSLCRRGAVDMTRSGERSVSLELSPYGLTKARELADASN